MGVHGFGFRQVVGMALASGAPAHGIKLRLCNSLRVNRSGRKPMRCLPAKISESRYFFAAAVLVLALA